MGEVLEAPNVEHERAPECVWRNWFQSAKCVVWHNAVPDGPGLWPPSGAYPSKLAAESAAQTGFAELEIFAPGFVERHGIEYLGAFPEGERPAPTQEGRET